MKRLPHFAERNEATSVDLFFVFHVVLIFHVREDRLAAVPVGDLRDIRDLDDRDLCREERHDRQIGHQDGFRLVQALRALCGSLRGKRRADRIVVGVAVISGDRQDRLVGALRRRQIDLSAREILGEP